MEQSIAARVPTYPCQHPKQEGHQHCPQCCEICGHPRGGPQHVAVDPIMFGGTGIEIVQCKAIDRSTLQRCNLIIGINYVTPAIITH